MCIRDRHGRLSAYFEGLPRIFGIYETNVTIKPWQNRLRLPAEIPIMEEEAKPDSIRFGLSILPIDEIFPLRSVGDHGDGVSDLVFNKFHIAPCIDWQVLILADTADIAFPAVQIGVDRLSPVQQRCDCLLYTSDWREFLCLFSRFLLHPEPAQH